MHCALPSLFLGLTAALGGCAETRLPVLAVPLSDNATFGTDLNAPDPVLGVTIIDPLGRMP
jgi:hypothetical protein